MDVSIEPADSARDARFVEALLHEVYVDAGFTDPAVAKSAFAPDAVFARGDVLVAREAGAVGIAGMVIVVGGGSPAARFASADEVELHLLAVTAAQRKAGLGAALVRAAVDHGAARGARRMLLWTQASMGAAQRLYERNGFQRAPGRDFEAGGRTFLVYERALERADPTARQAAIKPSGRR
jgi:ribosomal protein S18 acetylase RimI-like enzyme